MCKAINDLIEDGRSEGIELGRSEGIENAIFLLRQFVNEDEIIITKVAEQYGLSEDKVKEYM